MDVVTTWVELLLDGRNLRPVDFTELRDPNEENDDILDEETPAAGLDELHLFPQVWFSFTGDTLYTDKWKLFKFPKTK